jgi:hypothetical protein
MADTEYGVEPIHPHHTSPRPQTFSYCAEHLVIDCADCTDRQTPAGVGGWVSGGCPRPQVTANQALALERAVDHARDVLAQADTMARERGYPYLVGQLGAMLRQLVREIDEVL